MKSYLFLLFFILSISVYSTEKVPTIHLDLKDLLKRNLKNSLIINEKKHEEAKQLILIDEIRSRFYPRITVQNRLNWNVVKNDYTEDYDYYANLSVNWNLFGFYRNYKAIQLAHENLDILYLNHSQDKLADCISVIELYFQYWLQISMKELIKEDIAILDKRIKITDFLLKKGKASETELELLNNKRPVLKATLKKTDKNLLDLLFKIKKKLLINQKTTLLPPKDYSSLPPISGFDQKIEDIISSSPVMKAAKKNTELAEKNYGLSKYHRWSQINSSMYFSNSISLDDWDWERDKESFFLGFGISWGLPLFDAGQSKRNKERAFLGFKEAKQREESLVFELKEQIYALSESIHNKHQARMELEQKYRQKEKILSLKKIQFNNGKISENELMILKKENKSSRHALQEALYNEIISRLNFSILQGKLPSWLTGEELIL